MADGTHWRAARHDGIGLTRLPDRHIAHGIPGQKWLDLAIHILRDGHSGHLRPTLDYLQGLLFPLGLHWQLRPARCGFAGPSLASAFGPRIVNKYPRSESNRHWGPF